MCGSGKLNPNAGHTYRRFRCSPLSKDRNTYASVFPHSRRDNRGLLFLTSFASAQEPIRFARTPDISLDGKTIAFSYLGDIWTVEAIGGVARPVTMHEAHDINPIFSPDGKQIAFSSNRYGSYDVFVVSAVGGKTKAVDLR